MPGIEKRRRRADRARPRPGIGRAVAIALGAAAVTAAALASQAGARSAATPPSSTAAPGISGTAAVGSTLTGSPGSWSGDTPIAYAYRWERCNASGASCNDIGGATDSTYTLVSADAGNTIRLAVTASNSAGQASALSSATTAVASTPAPASTAAPALSGTAAEGSTLTVNDGTWSNASSFTYQWRRCDASGNNCADASGVVQSRDIGLVAADVGHTMRAIVFAKGAGGTTQAVTAPSAVVQAKSAGPSNTAAPSITGSAVVGQVLTANAGTWSPQPTGVTYRWQRCDTAGSNCTDASNAVAANTITLAAADAGHTMRVVVAATANGGAREAVSAQTAVVTSSATPAPAPATAGQIRLSDGRVSVSAESLALPSRLVISRVQFTPARLAGRAPFSLKVWVSDTQGHAVRDALVLATTIPYGWTRQPAETRTGTDGTVTFTLQPSIRMPLRNQSLLTFLRARNANGDPLAGISTRRLVQVRIG